MKLLSQAGDRQKTNRLKGLISPFYWPFSVDIMAVKGLEAEGGGILKSLTQSLSVRTQMVFFNWSTFRTKTDDRLMHHHEPESCEKLDLLCSRSRSQGL